MTASNLSTEHLVSCIVPVLNEKETILDFITSLHNQYYRPVELILVDGGSKDSTLELINSKINELQDEQFSIRLFKEKDFGEISSPANARNIGLDQAKGEFIFFIDSDTSFINPSILSSAVDEIKDRDYIIMNFKPLIDTKLEDHISKTIGLCGVILFRKNLLKNKRFIPTLGFGEDREFLFQVFGNLNFSREFPCSLNIGRHYPHNKRELRKQAEWYGRTGIRYLKVIYHIDKKEFAKQFLYVIYNGVMAFFPFAVVLSLVTSLYLTFTLVVFYLAQTLMRFIRYGYNTLDEYIFVLWYSIYYGIFFTKGLISNLYKKNAIGRR